MRTKLATILLGAFVLILPLPLEGQEGSSLRRILVFPSNGDAVSGRLLRMDSEYLTLLTTKREEKIRFMEINRIILSGESRGGRGAVYGAILGGYLATLAIRSQRGENANFLPDLEWLVLVIVTLPGALVGGGIGYLVDPGSTEEDQLFDFTGDETSRVRARERFQSYWSGEPKGGTFHVSVQAGQVSTAVTDQHGYPVPSGYYGSGTSSFNLLRKLQVSYSVIPEAEAGVAFVWFGEPKKYSYKYESSGNTSTSASLDQSFNAVGKYAVGVVKPLSFLPESRVKSRFDCSVGLGMGIASVDYVLNSSVSSYDNVTFVSTQQQRTLPVSETVLSGILYIDAGLALYDNLTIGLSYDQVFGPMRQISAIPEAGFPQKTIGFANSSYGFNIGIHF